MASEEVIHAYRHLYRGLLRAVQYSKPARFVARDKLRSAFREKQQPGAPAPAPLDPRAVKRTILFLNAAAVEAGLEHKILQNLLRTAYSRQRQVRRWGVVVKEAEDAKNAKKERRPDLIKDTAYRHYEMTIAMLNKTMGLCLR